MEKRVLSLILMVLLGCVTYAQDLPQQKLDSKIEHVAVFLNGAQVTRTVKATIPKGKSELILRGITPHLDIPSINVKGEGNFTIMSVKTQMNFLEEQKRKDTINSLEAQREDLWDWIIKDSSEVRVLEREEEILRKNRVQVLGLQQTPAKTEDLTALINLQRNRLKDIYDRQFQLQKSLNLRWLDIRKIQAQIKELSTRTNTTTAEVVITIFAKESAVSNALFKIEYIVPNTSWYPTYDIRVQDIQSPILAQMKAKVRQNSGEDWQNVQLRLSTGEPRRSGVKPELGTWFLGTNGYGYHEGQSMNLVEDLAKAKEFLMKNTVQGIVRDDSGEPLVGASVVINGAAKGTITDIEGRFSLDIPQGIQPLLNISFVGYNSLSVPAKMGSFMEINMQEDAGLQEVVVVGYGTTRKEDATGAVSTIRTDDMSQAITGRLAGVDIRGSSTVKKSKSLPLSIKEEEKPTTTAFDIDLPYSIPSNGKEYQVEIKEVSMPASYHYASAPKMDLDAFLTAEIINWEQYNLLEGEANLYLEGTFLGKTLLKTQSTEDTLRLSLGRDKNIVIKRTKLHDFGKTKMLSNKRHETRSFEIVVKNKKSYPLSITIEEQVPVSKDKRISINYEANGAKIDADTGRLTWELKLNSLEDKKLTFSYIAVYPDSWNVSLE